MSTLTPRKRPINNSNNNNTNKKSKINDQNKFVNNVLDHQYDQKFVIKIMNAISQSQLATQSPQNIPKEILIIIAVFAIGKLIPCCRLNTILVLPSVESIAEMYSCDHCRKLSCAFRCTNCIDQENRIKWYPEQDLPEKTRKYDEAIGSEFCTKCMWDFGTTEQNLCMNCVFICLRCRQYRCTRYHLQIICYKCAGGYCQVWEADFIKCRVCDIQCCNDCQWVWCKFHQNEINCGQRYHLCRHCYSSNIMKHYQSDDGECDKMVALIKKSKQMETYLHLPLNIIELICVMCD